MEDPAGKVEDHMWEGRLASRMVVSYVPDTDWELAVTVLVSTVPFLGMGSVLEGFRVGLTLADRLPLTKRLTSSSSVHRVDGDALCSRTRISLSRVWLRPLVEDDANSFRGYSGEELPLELPSYVPWRVM